MNNFRQVAVTDEWVKALKLQSGTGEKWDSRFKSMLGGQQEMKLGNSKKQL
ncbi:hypothetical protein DAPPUDRAFT_311029 [Daphnia pulex]|uniref:Uncharacterized protein n=1 Tax=Daphnia pulex TaxID=6669 RepID=E9FUF0_DAPPU|nr:hypothetical protein DAPPUDRAFT_311029 [Daphnia pulex]|eukprot:EFX88934.1 hypothetical protein DAPPUDRAFT_311029 [Daphnia pulex]